MRHESSTATPPLPDGVAGVDDVIKKAPLFAALDDDAAADLRRSMIEINLGRGQVLFREGEVTETDLGDGYDAVLCFNLVHHLEPDQIADLFHRTAKALNPG